MKAIMKFLKEEDGVSALEYGLIAAGVALALAGILTTFSTELTALFDGLID